MTSIDRRYDIDWLRVIAIGLLLVYHTAIAFQPWGFFIGFMTNSDSLEILWIPMSLLNIWRIPLLFFISGIGTWYMLRHKSQKVVVLDRIKRLLLPLFFGMLFIVPLQIMVVQYFYAQPISYIPNPAHLWFLGNIFIYLLLTVVLLRILRNVKLNLTLERILRSPISIVVVIALFVLEAWWVNPAMYELYAMTWHGFALGLLGFWSGYCFSVSGTAFFTMLRKWRFYLLAAALLLFLHRLAQGQNSVSNVSKAVESVLWILAIFSFASKHLNRGGQMLKYLSSAAYPIYIIHMLVLNLLSLCILPLEISPFPKYFILLIGTFGLCFICYELLIRRWRVARLLFGLKSNVRRV